MIMTLDTRIYVLDRIGHRELFIKCNQLIGAHEGIEFTDKPRETYSCISNDPDQELCALLAVYYRPGAPLLTEGEHYRYCDDDEETHAQCFFQRWAEVSLDTAYSYEGPEGDCGDLHARIISQLGAWLTARNISWKWMNEFTGEVHDGYDGLSDLGESGRDASDWLRNTGLPVINSIP
jgi:hypothetical protein